MEERIAELEERVEKLEGKILYDRAKLAKTISDLKGLQIRFNLLESCMHIARSGFKVASKFVLPYESRKEEKNGSN